MERTVLNGLMPLTPFTSRPLPRIIYGPGAVESAGQVAYELGAKRVLLVTDRGVFEAGHATQVLHALKSVGCIVTVCEEIHQNPTSDDLARCLEFARDAQPQVIMAIGGGSSIDAAKGCNFIYTNGGTISDYEGYGHASKPMLPLVAIPTTAGTGSEVQSYALISDSITHRKMACGDPKALAHTAILDPQLTLTCPPHVTACTGLDALAHALETAVTRTRNFYSRTFSKEAFHQLWQGLPRVFEFPEDLEARGAIQLGAAFAGVAIENSMLGAAHAAANPLTAQFDVVHGQAVSLMLPHVMRLNCQRSDDVRSIYDDLAKGALGSRNDAGRLIEALEALIARAGLKSCLSEVPIAPDAIAELAALASKQWTGGHNPVPLSEADFSELYLAAL